MKVFDPGAGPPVADLDAQRALGRSISHVNWVSFTVHYTRPTALGLVVLVDGDLTAAKRRLASRGVHLVGKEGAQDDVRGGVDPEDEAELIVHDALDPVVTEVRHRVDGLTGAGAGDIATWLDAGAVLLLGKRPIPTAVEQLTRLRPPSRARVVVEGAAYSLVDLARAQRRLGRIFGHGSPLRTMGACGDDSGLVVGVDTRAFADRAAALRRRYTAIAGLPVTVVARDAVGSSD